MQYSTRCTVLHNNALVRTRLALGVAGRVPYGSWPPACPCMCADVASLCGVVWCTHREVAPSRRASQVRPPSDPLCAAGACGSVLLAGLD